VQRNEHQVRDADTDGADDKELGTFMEDMTELPVELSERSGTIDEAITAFLEESDRTHPDLEELHARIAALAKNPIAQANQPGSTRTLTEDSAAPTRGEKTGIDGAKSPIGGTPDATGSIESVGHMGRKLADLGDGTQCSHETGPKPATCYVCGGVAQEWKRGKGYCNAHFWDLP